MRRFPRLLTVIGAMALCGTAAVPMAAADTGQLPVVEDYGYPGAAQVLADRGITLLKGDGHIAYVACSGPGLIEVRSTTVPGDHGADPYHYCFKIDGPVGDLTLNIPNAYQVKGDDHDVQATVTVKDKTSTVPVDKNGWTGVGVGAGPDPATLLEIKATGGSATTTPGDYPYLARVAIGAPTSANGRSCTGFLVAPRWLATAASCFADDPASPGTVKAGAPSQASTAAFPNGEVATIASLTPRTERDFVLAQLSKPVTDIAAAPLGATAPAVGDNLTVVGYGRTATTWTPVQPHATAYSVGSVAATTAAVSASVDTCKGDAGGPALRNGQIVAVSSVSAQHGCFNSTATASGSTEVRIDDLVSWIKQTTGVHAGPVQSGMNLGKCLDAQTLDGKTLTGGMQVWDCNGGAQQSWSGPADSLLHNGMTTTKCLDAQTLDGRTLTGSLQVWDCNGGPQQQWILDPANHTLHNGMDNTKCLDAQTLDGKTLTGSIQVWACNGGPQQQWF
jgi:V8-like Glu-specific endopeptidase